MEEIDVLKQRNANLYIENLNLKSELSYLKGQLAAYEGFLKSKGYIKGCQE